jgi:hypothetical protein
MATVKNQTTTRADKNMEELELPYIAGRNVIWATILETSLEIPQKVKYL